MGQLYSGALWVLSALAWSVLGTTAGVLVLLIGGFLIYPVTTLVSRLLSSAGSIPR